MSWDWDKLKKKQQQGDFERPAPPPEPRPKKELLERPSWVFQTAYVIILISLAVGLFFPVRWLHYKFAYEAKVEKQIIEMVKPEALKDKYK